MPNRLVAPLLGLSALLASTAQAASPWLCQLAPGALERKHQVEQSLLPQVLFVGETQPEPLAARMAAHRVPGLSVAVLRAGRLDWSASWGTGSLGGRALDCDSLFQAGSLAKPVTVLAALRMQQQGRLDLDRPVQHYLRRWQLPPGAQSAAKPVTLRHLLAHTAGITPGGYAGYAQGQPLPSDVQTVQGVAPSNARKVEVLAEPGRALRYSGGGYTVAEIALQDHFGQPFERLMARWILGPAGLRGANFSQPLPPAQQARAVQGHRADGSALPGGWHQHPEQAAVGLWATPSDLAALLIELHRGHLGRSKVFPQALVRELMAQPFEGHAYGFRLIGAGEQVFLTHYGGTAGYNAGMTLNLRSGDGAVYMANSENGLHLGPEFLGAVARAYGWASFDSQEWVTRRAQDEAGLQALAGRYRFAAQGWQIEVVFEQQALNLVFPNGDRYALAAIEGEGGLNFIHPATAVRARFSGPAEALQIELYGQTGQRQSSSN